MSSYDNTCKFLAEAFPLWEQPTEIFQGYLGLLPLSVLSKTLDPVATLRQTAQLIDNIEDGQVKNNVIAATAIISGLALNKLVIQQLLKSNIMKESVIYQDILAEGLAEGIARGIAEGKAKGLAEGIAEGKAKGIVEERNQIAMNMLRSNMTTELIAQITRLSIRQIEKLQKTMASPTKKPRNSKPKRSPNQS